MADRRPSLQQIINDSIAAGVRSVYTCIPAKVTRWDTSKNLVDCQILVQEVTRDEEDERQAVSVPVVTNVPVEFQGANGFRLTFPLSDGSSSAATMGSLVFMHR